MAMWLLTVLRMTWMMLTVLSMSWMMLTGLASGGNSAAALGCAQRHVGHIPIICRGQVLLKVVLATTGGIRMYQPGLCVLEKISSHRSYSKGVCIQLYKAAAYTAQLQDYSTLAAAQNSNKSGIARGIACETPVRAFRCQGCQ